MNWKKFKSKNFIFNGKSPDSREKLIELLRELPDNITWEVTLEKFKVKRRDRQNRLFHVWCAELADHCGTDPETMKIEMKHKFLPTTKRYVEGLGMMTVLTATRSITVDEMSKLLSDMQNWSRDFLNYELESKDKGLKVA